MAIVINSTTGEIDLNQTTPSTYIVTYTVQGVSSTQEVTVNAADNAGFSYSASSYTQADADPTPTITGLTGGTFSAGSGLVFVDSGTNTGSSTGEIDLSASTIASHTVTYSTSSSGSSVCPNTSTFSLAVTASYSPFQMQFEVASGASKTITIPGTVGSSYTVDWGDGTTTTESAGTITHTYDGSVPNPTVSIGAESDTGAFTSFAFVGGGSASDLLDVPQWGSIAWSNMASAFRGCNNSGFTSISATDTPNLSSVTSIGQMFRSCTNLATINKINDWDVSNVTNMAELFQSAPAFNQDLNSWDTSSVTTLNETFENASSFNGDISSWDVSNVTNMAETFFGATLFNQDVSGWNVSSVINMYQMFNGCSSFNQDVSGWDVSSVENMSTLFSGCSAFNQDISGWDTSSATTMGSMFNGATIFNANISSWDTSNVTTMGYMFRSANAFNQNISGWDVSKVNSFSRMFNPATSFNQNLGAWNLRTAGTVMSKVFADSTSMSTANYTDTVVGWANYVYTNSAPYVVNMASQTSMTFNRAESGGANFTNAGEARDYLTGATANWTITGDTEIN